jgi:16S rRNA (uracil1498-N3)-methyltransferase
MIPRLYVEATLAVGATVTLDHARTHYLRQVLRREVGAELQLFNGRDGEWEALIARFGRNDAALSVERQTRAQAASPDLWLLFAPLKRERIDILAEKATELGCRAIWPVFTQHTVVTRVNVERLAAHALEAAEQTERLDLPEIRSPRKLGEVLESWSPGRRLIVCAEFGRAEPIGEALSHMKREGGFAVLTGPEGGFHRSELDALGKLPFVTPVGLGPRVLRADTAALAALACWQAILGDGRERPPARLGI